MTVLLRSPCRGPGGQHVNKLSGLLAVLCGEHGIWQLLPLERPLPPVSLLPWPLPLPPLLVYRFPRAGPGSQPPGRFSCLCTQPCGRLTCVRPSATVCADARVPVCRRHCPELRGAGAGAPGARLRGLCRAPPPSALGLLSGSLPLSFSPSGWPKAHAYPLALSFLTHHIAAISSASSSFQEHPEFLAHCHHPASSRAASANEPACWHLWTCSHFLARKLE